MSSKDSKYVWVEVEPWDSTFGFNTEQSRRTKRVKKESKSEETAYGLNAAGRTDLYVKHETRIKSKSDDESNELKVKTEVKDSCGSSKASAHAGVYLKHEEAEEESDSVLCVIHDVKSEREQCTQGGLCLDNAVKTEIDLEGEDSAAAAQAGLYLNHEVKEELVVGPEELQRPKTVPVCPVSANTAEENGVAERNTAADRTCSVKLETMDVDMKHRTCSIGRNKYKFHLFSQGHQKNDIKRRKRKIRFNDGGWLTNTSHLKIGNTLSEKNMDTEEKVYQCVYCSFTSVYKRYIAMHKKIAHAGEDLFKCDQCNYSCADTSTLNRHKRSHTGEKPYKCDQCNFACSRKNNLRHHKWVHSKDKPYKCDQCDYTNAHKYALQAHISAKHASENVYRCDQCKFATVRKDRLLTHKKQHSFASTSKDYSQVVKKQPGDKPYKCDQCNYDSAREDLLQIHKTMMHTNENPYKCHLCSYACAREDKLQSHKRLHTKDNPYKCDRCNYATALKCNLQRHVRIHADKPYKLRCSGLIYNLQ